jgi:proline iminopeptidase
MIQPKNRQLLRNIKALAFTTFLTLALTNCQTEDPTTPGLLVPKTADQDTSIPSIVVNGAKLHSEAFGNENAPIIIALHGGPGADYRYLLNCKAFAEQGYRVVFYDQRGSGLSQRFPKSSYSSVNVLVEELKGVIKYYRKSPNQKVFLLGHSWGGMLATAYINENPTDINGVVIAEAGGFIWQDVKDYLGRSRSFNFLGEDLNNLTYVDQFMTNKNDEHEIIDYKFGLLAWNNPNEGNEGIAQTWRGGGIILPRMLELGDKDTPNWTINLSKFKTKVLFIYSENNTAYGLDHAKKVSSAYPNVTLFKALKSGHNMFSFPTGWKNCYPEMLAYFNTLK